MNLTADTAPRRLKPKTVALLATVGLLVVGSTVWLATPLSATKAELQRAEKIPNLIISRGVGTKRAYILPKRVQYDTGVVFYPASHVEAEAYIATLAPLAEQSQIAIFIVKPRLTLPALDPSLASSVMAEHPRIKRWYVAGHGAGGTAACTYAKTNSAKILGVMLLNGACWNNFSRSNLQMLRLHSQYGRPIDPTAAFGGKKWQPKRTKTAVIAGASHASFGSYGQPHSGGKPTRTADQITEQIAIEIQSFLSEGRQ